MKQKHNVTAEKLGIQLSTGTLAGLAGGAVTISLGETILFVSATAASTLRTGQDFFPLTVDYKEKFTAAGKFPGGYFKREGRPSEKEILTSRLCDRPLRPLFPKGFLNEVQVIGYLLSTDQVNEADVLMVNGASAALMISDIPWNGPIGCVRLGEINGEFIVNPTNEQMYDSALDLIYVGSEKEMMMIEGSADQMPEDRFVEALEYAHEQIQEIISAQHELAKLCGKEKKVFDLVKAPDDVLALCREITGSRMDEAIFADSKQARAEAVDVIKEEALVACEEKFGEAFDPSHVKMAFEVIQEDVYRENILIRGKRADGREAAELREISCETGVLPRVHGSAIFTRGETQAIVVATLGAERDAQMIDAVEGEYRDRFMLHYNFPPFCVGETGFVGSPKRREIGHGKLAWRALQAVLPAATDFPYTIRVVSEITESNGSSSMASVCGGSLSMMDAGVPLKSPVAGVAMGLVMEDDGDYAVLTDILGDEDHLGDMDFKVAGTEAGITSLQMDIKIAGITQDIMKKALAQAKAGRLHILDEMNKSITGAQEFSVHAPRIETMNVPTDKIREVIGSGGKVIREIVEVSGAKVDINDEGVIKIASPNADSIKKAYDMIYAIVAEPELNKIYQGKVVKVVDFGAFVNFFGKRDGLVHVSQIENRRLNHPSDALKEGQDVSVKLLGFDDRGKVRLAMKMVDQKTGEEIVDEAKPEE